MRFFLHK